VTVSAFALMVRRPILGSFAQKQEWNEPPSHQDDLTPRVEIQSEK
jgi:hypothetical protein